MEEEEVQRRRGSCPKPALILQVDGGFYWCVGFEAADKLCFFASKEDTLFFYCYFVMEFQCAKSRENQGLEI